MVTEAATLAQNSINAIDTLLSDDIPSNTANKIIADTALSHWGIKYAKKWFKNQLELKDGSDTLTTAKGWYLNVTYARALR